MVKKFLLVSALFMGFAILVLGPVLDSGRPQTGGLADALTLGTSSAYAQGSGIVIEGADAVWEVSTQPSDALAGAAMAVTPRILAEYADSVLSVDLQESGQLAAQAASVSPRILVEYADSILSLDLVPPLLVSNEQPTADAGSDQTVSPGTIVTLDGSGSRDQDGSIVSYEWDFGDGAGGTGKTVTHTYSGEGAHTVTLTVTDNDGAKATAEVMIRVAQPNRPPRISDLQADQGKVNPGATVRISATAVDDDGDTIAYRWTCDQGSISGQGSSVVWTAPDRIGTYAIRLAVDDGRGSTDSDSVSVRVSSETVVTPSDPRQPYVDLHGQVTDVVVGEEIILQLSVVNPITSPGTLVVQLTLRIPSGWSITSSGFGHGAGGLRTNTYEIEQGPNPRVIEVHIVANEPFEGVVEGKTDYYFEGLEKKYHDEVSLPVSARSQQIGTAPATEPAGTESSPKDWWTGPQWLVMVSIAGIACLVGVVRLVIRLTRGP